jgi:hypothetical protein
MLGRHETIPQLQLVDRQLDTVLVGALRQVGGEWTYLIEMLCSYWITPRVRELKTVLHSWSTLNIKKYFLYKKLSISHGSVSCKSQLLNSNSLEF